MRNSWLLVVQSSAALMTSIPIPENAIGKVGMVAMLRRLGDEHQGKLVAVRVPVGFISTLTPSGSKTFAWQVLVLGDPVIVNGKSSREIVVADRCLVPVSQIEPEDVNKLAIAKAELEFDLALAELRRYLAAHPMSPGELDLQVDRCAEQFEIQHALSVVSVAVVLEELGFRVTSQEAESSWHWSGVHEGVELYVMAGQDMFGRWSLVGRLVSSRQLVWDERVVPEDGSRGSIALIVLELWRTAFGKSTPAPLVLQIAEVYERHRQDMRALNIGLPTIYVDGEVFRATRRWLVQRHGHQAFDAAPAQDKLVTFNFEDGLLLRISIDRTAYGCPAQGAWIDKLQVQLVDLLKVPHWALRGAWIRVQVSSMFFSLNGWDVATCNGA